MSSFEILGDRCKAFESAESDRRSMHMLPVICRLDGRGFSKFTKGLARPFDKNFSHIMQATAKYLIEESSAKIAYTQSDEITLILFADSYESELFFGGKFQKLTSTLASLASVKFNILIDEFLPAKSGLLPTFDCRVFAVPNKEEAINNILWRSMDCQKNSISMAARCFYSHRELMNVNRAKQLSMLSEKRVNWEKDYPNEFKYGIFLQKKSVFVVLGEEERLKIPEHVRPSSEIKVQRSHVSVLDIGSFNEVQNKIEVVFNSEDPVRISLRGDSIEI